MAGLVVLLSACSHEPAPASPNGVAPAQVAMELVRDDKYVEFPPYDIFPQDPGSVPQIGPLSSPRGSTPELGRLIIEDMGSGMARLLSQAFGGKA